MQLNRIREYAEKKGIKWATIAEVADFTSTNALNYAIENEVIKATAIEKLALFFEINVNEFFESTNTSEVRESSRPPYGSDYARTADVRDLGRKIDTVMEVLNSVNRKLEKA